MGSIPHKDRECIESMLNKTLGSYQLTSLEKIDGGLTNRTYRAKGEMFDLVVRLPGEGTEEIICRRDEKVSTQLACDLGIDSELLLFEDNGAKVSRYIPQAETLTAERLREPAIIEKAARIFRTLHSCGVDTGVDFDVFEMAMSYETFIQKNSVRLYGDYADVKRAVMEIKAREDSRGASEKVPCHNDSLCANWILDPEGRLYLIDWEYAGMNSGMWDLADISIEAAYGEEEDRRLLEAYFGRQETQEERSAFVANKIYLDYLWSLWGLSRIPFNGQEMQDYADQRYDRMKKNLAVYKK